MFTTNSARRVEEQTAGHIQKKIERLAEQDIAYYAAHRDQIDRRLGELDREWDTERVVETLSAGLSLFGLVRGLIFRRKWLLLPVVVQSFMLQHALQGWCPPMAVLRRMGFRTRREIDDERVALKAIRGDFSKLPENAIHEPGSLDKIIQAARA